MSAEMKALVRLRCPACGNPLPAVIAVTVEFDHGVAKTTPVGGEKLTCLCGFDSTVREGEK